MLSLYVINLGLLFVMGVSEIQRITLQEAPALQLKWHGPFSRY